MDGWMDGCWWLGGWVVGYTVEGGMRRRSIEEQKGRRKWWSSWS